MIIFNKYKITNIKRFRTFLFITALIFSLITFLIISSFTKVYSSNEIRYKSICVEEGDTLWQIASDHKNDMNIDKYIYEIQKINNMNISSLYPGQTLIIPIY